jgi:uncharacterized protein (DUF486 family)
VAQPTCEQKLAIAAHQQNAFDIAHLAADLFTKAANRDSCNDCPPNGPGEARRTRAFAAVRLGRCRAHSRALTPELAKRSARGFPMWTIVLLLLSNVFMTFAWYGHLKFKSAPLYLTILVSWGIALFEYCLQVPANRMGHNSGFAAAELKTIQEVITLSVFVIFSYAYLKEPIAWNVAVGFGLIAVGAAFVFKPW